jgi:bifunctional pyridoxal-dependent enzyme with beta-cystathionase and maltose regulon repressor activities
VVSSAPEWKVPNRSGVDRAGRHFLVWLDFRELGFSADELNNFLRQKAEWQLHRGISFGPEGLGFSRQNNAVRGHG